MIPPPPRPTLFPYTTLFRSTTARAKLDQTQATAALSPDVIAAQASLAQAELALHSKHQSLDQLSAQLDRKSTRLNSSHGYISYAVFCLKKKTNLNTQTISKH